MNQEILVKRLGDLAIEILSLEEEVFVKDAFLFFMRDESLRTVPVVNKEGQVIGRLQRKNFLERIVLGKYGYGIHLNGNKKITEVMEPVGLILGPSTTLEEAAIAIKNRNSNEDYDDLYDDIIVVDEKNHYLGIVPVHILLEALAQKSLQLARDCNPLTGLPGNWAIKRNLEERLAKGNIFEVIYIDLNDFKPFNDKYGFAKGDEVIITLGEIIKKIGQNFDNVFPAHLGGDDFIVICKLEDFCRYM